MKKFILELYGRQTVSSYLNGIRDWFGDGRLQQCTELGMSASSWSLRYYVPVLVFMLFSTLHASDIGKSWLVMSLPEF
jgi:hypothetical protein